MRHTNQKKKSRADTALFIKRVFLLILALLMILGSIYYVVFFTFVSAENLDGSEIEYRYEADQKMRVGLLYDDGVRSSYNIKADNGYTYGYVKSNVYYPIVSDSTVSVTATLDGNLNKSSSGTFTLSEVPETAVVGGYHLQLEVADQNSFINALESCRTYLGFSNINCFPAFINGNAVIRIGSETTEAAAGQLLTSVSSILSFSGLSNSLTVVGPSATCVTIVAQDTNAIVYEYDDTTGYSDEFGMEAIQNGIETSYILSPANNSYSGTFIFGRYNDGISLINIVTIEEYVEGVLPYEIGPSWSDEAQKAFSVAVRSYALTKRGRHSSLGFDICSSICCQVYRGCGRTTENVRENVKATEGLVVLSGGKVASTFYSASTGGCTVSNADCWGSSLSAYPYLAAKATPWEKYEEHLNGAWSVSLSPYEIASALRSNVKNSNITGDIQSIVINSLSNNSSYVYSMTFTDVNGNSLTIKKSDTIRLALSPYLKSANFVVGRAGETVTVTDFTLDGYDELISKYSGISPAASSSSASENVPQTLAIDFDDFFGGSDNDGIDEEDTNDSPGITSNDNDTLTILTKDGIAKAGKNSQSLVMTGTGLAICDNAYNVITVNGSGGISSESFEEKLFGLEITSTTRQVVLEGEPGEFVFYGRGHGHGVGLSQWGVHDLAEVGANFKTIVKAYYNDSEIVHYTTIPK